jgi:hypothetical protein
LFTNAHMDELQTFVVLRKFRCTLAERPETDSLEGPLFRGTSLTSTESPSPPPITVLDITLEIATFAIQQLLTLARTLRVLRIKTYDTMCDLRGFEKLIQLVELTLDSSSDVPHAFTFPPTLTTLRITGNPSTVLVKARPEALVYLTDTRLVYDREYAKTPWPDVLQHMISLRHLSLTYSLLSVRRGTTRMAPITPKELATLPKSLHVFEYSGPPCPDFTPLKECLELHTFAYRTPSHANTESISYGPGVLPTNCLWTPLRALRSLTVWEYWHDAPELFPALTHFFFSSQSPLAITKRDAAMLRFTSLQRFEPDPQPSGYLNRSVTTCNIACCCCPSSNHS